MVSRWLLLAPVVWSACASSPSDPLDDAFDATGRIDNVTSVSVRRDGAVLREAYYRDTDRTTLHDVRSVTKTVTSLLIGAAIDTGCIASVDQPIGALLGDEAPSDPAKAAIEVRDLLTMTSGFAWLENGAAGDYNSWALAPNQVEYVLARDLSAPHGTEFNYDSGAFHLLSAILTHACAPTPAFADQHLFGPLGIATPPWETDQQGLANGAAGVQLTNAQLSAIGQLILDRGQYGGAQLVSAAYIDMATQPQISTVDGPDQPPEYGFGLWVDNAPGATPFVLAEGYGGQLIAIVPDRHAVVVATTRWEGVPSTLADDNYVTLYRVLTTALLPAL